MPKSIKGNATRKPPDPADDHAVIEEWIPRLMPHLQPIIEQLDASIRGAIPKLQYAVKWKRAYYGTAKLGWVIELAPYDVSVNVVFLGGADFKSPPSLGSVDRSRYVKVKSLEEAEASELQKWLKEAGRVPGWK